ncbi:MAG: cadherin-like beta sandwich domain-containing protein, partial [Gemmatimonadota bacterium]|nr:cadherin-like beta sandwich domain-containing protein [Gemmatimonadota bacterium]
MSGSTSTNHLAQQFTTGSNASGYTLSEVIVRVHSVPSDASTSNAYVTIKSNNGGVPGNLLAALSNPDTLTSGLLTFTAPAGTTLANDSSYFVVLNEEVATATSRLRFNATNSHEETGLPGWSITDGRRWKSAGGVSWNSSSGANQLIAIRGYANVTASTDATLASLAVSPGTLAPVFHADSLSYAAAVSNAVAQVTVTAAATDADGATVEYLDENDAELTDADGADGHQVDLDVGGNTVKVKVTAEDGSTTRTYVLTLTRLIALPPVGPNADGSETIWSAQLTVRMGTNYTSEGGGYYRLGNLPAQGGLTSDSFTYDGTTFDFTYLGTDANATGADACASGLKFAIENFRGTGLWGANHEDSWELHVGSHVFDFADVPETVGSGVTWCSPSHASLGFEADATIAVSIVKRNAPGAPTGLTTQATDTTTISLSWTAPEKTGGDDILGYQIEVSPDGQDNWTVLSADTTSTATTYDHTGLSAGDTRYYRVAAINSIGTGMASAVESGQTQSAPTDPTLVSNTGQPELVGATSTLHAQPFTTGSNPGGYVLTSVGVNFASTTDGHVRILSHDSGPGTVVATLTGPATNTAGIRTFTAPANTTLAADTTYYVEVEGASRGAVSLIRTGSAAEDSVRAEGWSIGDARYWRLSINDSWTLTTSDRLMIEIKGTLGSGQTDPPSIESIAFTSDPNDDDREGDDDTYAIGDVISATVTFSEAVAVDTTGGKPSLTLTVGDTAVAAAYADGTGTAALVFSYTVAEGVEDTVGISIAANALNRNGGTIQAGTTDATLTHDAEPADAGHKVDGIRPTFVKAETSTDGTKVIVTFSEALSSASRFTVIINNLSSSNTATVSGSTVELTLPSSRTVVYGDAIEVWISGDEAYDLAGNGNAATTPVRNSVDNKLPQPAAVITGVAITSDPGTDSIYVTGDTIEVTVTFDQSVAVDTTGGTPRILLGLVSTLTVDRWAEYDRGTASTELVFGYTVTAGDESDTDGLLVLQNTLELNGGSIVKTGTTAPAHLAHLAAGNDGNHRVNWERPTFVSAVLSADRTQVVVTFSENLYFFPVQNAADPFTVKVNGLAVSLTSAVPKDKTAILTLAAAAASGQSVTVSYADPTTGDDNAVQDWAQNDAVSFTDQTVAAPPASTDATLASLGVSPGTLAPAFHADSLSYAATVSNSVSRVTVTPVTNDDGATVEYLDENDAELTDADGATGHQVDLDVGQNTVKVKVTAEDGSTTRTYVLKLTREAPVPSDPTLVSNTGQTAPLSFAGAFYAQPFTTGSNDGGYALTSVGINFVRTGSANVSIRSHDSGPDSVVATLTGPPTNYIGLRWYTAPAGTTLAANTTFYVEVTGATVTGTSSTAEDSGAAEGWSIGDTLYWRTSANASWTSTTDGFAQIEIKGTLVGDTDTTPPSFVSTSENNTVLGSGINVTLAFDEPLDSINLPDTAAFTVTADGARIPVTEVEVVLQQLVRLGLGRPVGALQTVKVSYADPTSGDDPAAIQDLAGNDAASLSDVSIGNVSGLPPLPKDLTATRGTDAVTLSWTMTLPPGATLTRYDYRVSTDRGATWGDGWTPIPNSASLTSYDVPGLTLREGAHFTFELRGVNSNGDGPAAEVGLLIPVSETPTQPQNLTATPGSGSVTLNWDPVQWPGGVQPWIYEYRQRVGSGAWGGWTGMGSAHKTDFHVTGLDNGTTYDFQVRAVGRRWSNGAYVPVPGPESVVAEGTPTSTSRTWRLRFEEVRSEAPGNPRHVVTSIKRGGNPVEVSVELVDGSTFSASQTLGLAWGGAALGSTGPLRAASSGVTLAAGQTRTGTLTLSAPVAGGTAHYDVPDRRAFTADLGMTELASEDFTIYDDDEKPVVSLGASRTEIAEGDSVTMTVTADPTGFGAAGTTVLIDVNDPNDKFAGDDTREVVFASGDASKEVVFRSNQDERRTSNAPVGFLLRRPDRDHERDSYTITDEEGKAVVHVVVTDDDEGSVSQDTVTIDIKDTEAYEENTLAVFTVFLSAPPSGTVTVDYETRDSTAVAGSDYEHTTGTLTIEAGEPDKSFGIELIDDRVDEVPEFFKVVLSNPTGGAVLGDSIGVGTITNYDPPPLTASFEDVPAEHDGESAFSFRVRFSEDVGLVRDRSFTVAEGEVTETARVGGSSALWEITVEPDSDEAVDITLPGGRDCGATGAVCTAGDDERPLSNSPSATVAGPPAVPALSVSDASATEGGDVDFTVSLSDASAEEVTVEYETAGGTATAGVDFTSRSGTLTFAANETTQTVSVATTDDEEDEEDETFTLTLSSPANATLDDAAATGTIVDDDEAAAPLTARFSGMPSGHTGAEFTFELHFSEEVEVSYVTLENDAFELDGGSVEGARRLVSKSNQGWNVTVKPTGNGDVTITLPETTDCTATGAICTEDGRPLSHSLSATVAGPAVVPALSVSDASATEGAPVVFTVSLSPATGEQVTVAYETAGGTATAGVDFTSRSGTLTFAANETTQTVSVATTDDEEDEEDETFTLTLSSPANATLDDGTARGTIVDDDEAAAPLTARFEDMPSSHTGAEFTFRVAFSEDIDVSYRVLRDSAFVVTGGKVLKAQRVDGRNDLRRITLEPASATDTVRIRLPETTDCGGSAAICTADGRPLSHSLSATVAPAASASASNAANQVVEDDGLEDALALLRGVTPDAASAALFGEGALSEAQLEALDRLGNRNGRYDLGDMLSWRDRCRMGEAACGQTSSPPGPASSALLFGLAAAGRRRGSGRADARPRRRPRSRGAAR